jgi:spermidine/putrescine transport system ATP-binding protein
VSPTTATATTAIDIRDVTKLFGTGPGALRALDGVSLAIRENEFFTLLGPSGCGKTTLLRLIAGFEQPTSGEIDLYGDPLGGLPPFRRPVNTVFQSYALFPHMTVAQNVRFGLEMQGGKKADMAARVEEMLALVQLERHAGRTPAQLSGGQQQRVALARALANQPKVLLLDEPLSALDLKLRKEMQVELKRLQTETGITFIFVTHDQEEALTMSDRLAVMHEGAILQVGRPEELYEHPTHRFVADFIGETNFLEATLAEAGAEGVRLRLDTGAEIAAVRANGHAAGSRVTLAIRPERVALEAPDRGGGLPGTVDRVVYFGTDTTYHVTLEGIDAAILVRVQNRTGAGRRFQEGDQVRLHVPPEAVQVLRD